MRQIHGDELAIWAQRIEAASTLPELVRRLILATVNPEHLEMRADGGVRFAGWDGVVCAISGSTFCPEGESRWELSVDERSKPKFDRDFGKRTASDASLSRTYVAVTARRFSDKSQWERDQRAKGGWANVRALDADDLAAWLHQAPAVAAWFAAQHLGQPVAELSTIQESMDEWTNQTNPPLPRALLTLGKARQEGVERVRQWIKGPPTRLIVRADSALEATAFVSCALMEDPIHGTEFASRTLVLRSDSAVRWANRQAEALVLLPGEGVTHPVAPKHHSILSLPTPSSQEAHLLLERVPHELLEQALKRAGCVDAAWLAKESGGALSALARLCGSIAAPAWAEHVTPPMVAMLLVGAWTPTQDADREALRRFDLDPTEVNALCTRLASLPGAPIQWYTGSRGPGCWKWVSHEDGLQVLAPALTSEGLERFRTIALTVLQEDDPSFTIPLEQRFYAAIQGKVLRHSSALREGIARSIARLSVSNGLLPRALGPCAGSALGSWILRDLLSSQWERWASLREVLPILAEAAPDVFLNQLQDSLNEAETGVAHLFGEEGPYSSPHTGLLWALERLGWDETRMGRVALALARLACADPGGNLANRPLASLLKLLHPLRPSTRAPLPARVAALRRICEQEPSQGWPLSLEMIRTLRGCVVHSADKPEYSRNECEPPLVTTHDAWEMAKAAADILPALAGEDTKRWVELLGRRSLPLEVRLQVVRAAKERLATGSLSDTDQCLWTAAREALHGALKMQYDDDACAELRDLYSLLTPRDQLAQVLWLFSRGSKLPEYCPGGWREEDARLVELRLEAIRALGAESGVAALLALAKACDDPVKLGMCLAETPLEHNLDDEVFQHDGWGRVRPSFFGVCSRQRGPEWTRRRLGEVLKRYGVLEAVACAHSLEHGAPTWDLVEQLGTTLRDAYWKDDCVRYPANNEDAARAVFELLRIGGSTRAVDVAGHHAKLLPVDIVITALEAFDEDPDVLSCGAWILEELFRRLGQTSEVDETRIIRLELKYLCWLTESHGGHPDLRLFQAISERPELFADFVCQTYRRASDKEETHAVSPDEMERRRAVALIAGQVLHEWKGFPGSSLTGPERDEALRRWSKEVLRLTAENDRRDVGEIELANVLARVPSGADNLWPCVPARELLERHHTRFRDGLGIAKCNLRGFWTKEIFEGGEQETAIAWHHQDAAAQLRADWPETAAFLDTLATRYGREAQVEDARARSERLEAGYEEREEPGPGHAGT